MTRLMFFLCILSATFFLSSCGDDSRTKLFEAQVCIDKISVSSTSTKTELDPQVDACMEKISGQTTRDSYVIRCAGDFIRQGFAESTIYSVVESLDKDKKDGASDPTGTVLTLLAFESTDEAAIAVSNCGLSQSEALIDLADLANLATILKAISGGNGQTIDELIENFDPDSTEDMDDEEKLQLANALIATQGSVCKADKGVGKDSETCENINGAISENSGQTDAEKIALINQFMANSKSGDD